MQLCSAGHQGWLRQEPDTKLLCSPVVTVPGTPGPQLQGLKPHRLLNTGQAVALLPLSNWRAAQTAPHSCHTMALAGQGVAPQPPLQTPPAKHALGQQVPEDMLAPSSAFSSNQQQTRS